MKALLKDVHSLLNSCLSTPAASVQSIEVVCYCLPPDFLFRVHSLASLPKPRLAVCSIAILLDVIRPPRRGREVGLSKGIDIIYRSNYSSIYSCRPNLSNCCVYNNYGQSVGGQSWYLFTVIKEGFCSAVSLCAYETKLVTCLLDNVMLYILYILPLYVSLDISAVGLSADEFMSYIYYLLC